MKLDVNEVYHNYIIKIIIFASFLHKKHIRKQDVFKHYVLEYVGKRIPWKINLKIDFGEFVPIKEQRNQLLDELLYNKKSDYLSYITVSFNSPLKETVIKIDLRDEKKYEKFIYS